MHSYAVNIMTSKSHKGKGWDRIQTATFGSLYPLLQEVMIAFLIGKTDFIKTLHENHSLHQKLK